MPIIDNRDTGGSGGAVASVNGQTGIVTITPTSLGLGNVQNTSDANKPISTATQTQFDRRTPHPKDGFYDVEHWNFASFAGKLSWQAAVGGGLINTASLVQAGRSGFVQISTSTSATSTPSLSLNGTNQNWMLGTMSFLFETDVKLNTALSTATEEYIARVGLCAAAAATEPTNGVWFDYNRSAAGDVWRIRTRDNSVDTITTTTTPVTTGWVRLKIWINAAGTLAKFFIDGTKVGEITTTIPINATAKAVGPWYQMVKSVGTTGRTLFLDWAVLGGGTGAPDPELP